MISMESTDKKFKSNFKSHFYANLVAKVGKLKKDLIVISILHLLGLPLLMTATVLDVINTDYFSGGFVVLGYGCLIAALLCGFTIALSTFDYLYKKHQVDMIYSLPLTRTQQFLSDYLAGLLVYTIPYLLSIILTVIIHTVSSVVFIKYNEEASTVSVIPIILKLALSGLLLMIMFYTLTVLVTCCCGSMFEAIAYNIMVNGLIPGVIAIFFVLYFDDLYGIEVSDYVFDYISYGSPLGSWIGFIQIGIKGVIISNYNSTATNSSPLIRWYVINFLADVLYFFFAMFLYNKRKAEDVSKPFVFKAFYYVFISALTFIIIAVGIKLDDYDYTIPMIIFSAIVYFILEIISNRGFKKFLYSAGRYVITLVATIIFSGLLSITKGFGVETSVPNPSNIMSVTVNFDGYYNSGTHYYSYSSGDSITFTDRDSIKAVVELHKDAIQNRFVTYAHDLCYDNYSATGDPIFVHDGITSYPAEYSYTDDYYKEVTFTYTTFFGRNISRSYEVSFEQYMMLKELSVDKSYINYSCESFQRTLLSSGSHTDYSIDVSSKLNMDSKTYTSLTQTEILALSSAYQKDMKNRTLEDIMTPNDVYCILNGYIIFDSYENTIEFLTSHNYTPPSIESDLSNYSNYSNYSENDIVLYQPENIVCGSGEYYGTVGAYKATYGKILYYTNKSVLELLKVAQPCYITTEECYMLYFGNTMYAIPPEYSSLAESVYSSTGQSSVNSNVDYSNSYSELYSIWTYESQLQDAYPDFSTFCTELFKGQIDTSLFPSDTQEYATLKHYYNIYWEFYYDDEVQDRYNTEYFEEFSSYDDYVNYIMSTALTSVIIDTYSSDSEYSNF